VTLPDGEIIEVPAHSALGPILIYIFAAAAVLGLTLSKIPLKALKVILRLLFALLFSWGAFIATVFYLPLPVAVAIAVVFGTFWFLIPLVWLHNLVLILGGGDIAFTKLALSLCFLSMRLVATTSERQAALIKDWVTIRYTVVSRDNQ